MNILPIIYMWGWLYPKRFVNKIWRKLLICSCKRDTKFLLVTWYSWLRCVRITLSDLIKNDICPFPLRRVCITSLLAYRKSITDRRPRGCICVSVYAYKDCEWWLHQPWISLTSPTINVNIHNYCSVSDMSCGIQIKLELRWQSLKDRHVCFHVVKALEPIVVHPQALWSKSVVRVDFHLRFPSLYVQQVLVFNGHLFTSFINLQSRNLFAFSHMLVVCNKTMYIILKLIEFMKCKFYNIRYCIGAANFVCKICFFFWWPSVLSFCTASHWNDRYSRIAISACVASFVSSIKEELLHSVLHHL